MNFDVIATKAAGIVGALVSMGFLRGTWPERLVSAVSGAALSLYAAPYLAHKLSLPEGLAGFLLGLFGMAIVSAIWAWLQTGPIAPLWSIVVDWLRKRAGLEPK